MIESYLYGMAPITWNTWNGTNYKKMTDLVKNENYFDFIVA